MKNFTKLVLGLTFLMLVMSAVFVVKTKIDVMHKNKIEEKIKYKK